MSAQHLLIILAAGLPQPAWQQINLRTSHIVACAPWPAPLAAALVRAGEAGPPLGHGPQLILYFGKAAKWEKKQQVGKVALGSFYLSDIHNQVAVFIF